MLTTVIDGPLTVSMLVGKRAILEASEFINAFRAQTLQAQDPLTSLHYYLGWTWARNGVPVAAMVSRSGHIFGIVLFCLRRKFGIPLGMASAGTAAGDASVIAYSEDRQSVIEAACKAMVNFPAIHTVLCTVEWPDDVDPGTIWPISGMRGHWHFRETRTRLSLHGGADAVMDRMGYKMRRNIRSYRRRAESSMGCRFVSDLTEVQRGHAVSALHNRDVYCLPTRLALRFESVLCRLPGAFAVGTQDSSGSWLSYIAGWRKNGETHVVWQLNDATLPRSSMSTTMRAYLLEHEVERGGSALIFVGGTSAVWGRACEPTICGDLLALRDGTIGTLARRLSGVVSPNGQISRLHSKVS